MALIKYREIDSYSGKQRRFDGFTRQGKLAIAIPAIILLLFIFCFRTVGAGNVGIITRFGNVDRVATSGIALKLPWPIEHIEYMEVRVQKQEEQASAATKDQQDVNVKLALNYALDNETALRVYKELGKDYVTRVVTPAVQESFKAASANYTAPELITERPAVKAKAYEIIKDRLNKYGIRVVDLSVVDLKYSAEYNAAIEAVQIANQNVAKAKQELETTKVQAEKDIAAAQGAAEAQRLQQQTLTPELIRKLEIDSQNQAIAKWNGVLPTTNASGSGGFLFNIPANR